MIGRSSWWILVAGLGLATVEAGAAPPPAGATRVATFNASLNRDRAGQLAVDLAGPDDPQARNVAEIVQRVRPDILVMNEFDYDAPGRSVTLFHDNYLARPQHGAEPIAYPYRYSAAVNTGVASGVDLDNDGTVATEPGGRGYGNDAFGYGVFPGQYGMAVYSRFPIDAAAARRFGAVRWRDQPGALLPRNPDGTSYYSDAALKVFRLSSKDHWDVPVRVGGRTVHLLVSHPTPPSFDGPEDRNGRRNHDEIRLWADYLAGGDRAAYLGPQAAPPPTTFIIFGDQNADPVDGGSVPGAIAQLLDHPRVARVAAPRSAGAAEAARLQGGANLQHKGDPAEDTADFDDRSVGNLRADYVLQSRDLPVVGSGVFWPEAADPLARLVRMTPAVASSDHRLVYLDLKLDTQGTAP